MALCILAGINELLPLKVSQTLFKENWIAIDQTWVQ
jgi:hypothetical protein